MDIDIEGASASAPIGQRWRRPAVAALDLGRAVVLGIATGLSVSAVMLVAQATDVSQLPAPMAVAFAHKLLGAHVTMRDLLPIGLLLHTGWVTAGVLGYVTLFRRRLTFGAALTVALALWLVAGLVFTPVIGWGLFAAGLGSKAVLAVAGTHLLFAVFAWALCAIAFPRVDLQDGSKA